jgi:hypothetical protein
MIEIRWWASRSRALAAYVGLFAVLLTYVALRSGQFEAVHRGLMAGFALVLAYTAAFRSVNVTRLGYEGDSFTVSHGPLPGRSGLRVARARVARVSVDARRLVLVTTEGDEVVLLDDLRGGDDLGAKLARLHDEPA